MINVRGLPADKIDSLVDTITDTLGAQFFRDKELFMEGLSDSIEKAQNPRAFLYGPYIKLNWATSGDLRISASDAPVGGETVYALDTLQALIDSGEAQAYLRSLADDKFTSPTI
jgi:hypothetical protein